MTAAGGAVRVLVATGDPRVRELLCRAVEGDGGLNLAGVCGVGQELLARAGKVEADVVALDVCLSGPKCYEMIGRVGAAWGRPVVAMGAQNDMALATLAAGAADFVYLPLDDNEKDVGQFTRAFRERVKIAGVRPCGGETGARGAAAAVAVLSAGRGGVAALAYLLGRLPAGHPPVLLYQRRQSSFSRNFPACLARLAGRAVTPAVPGPLRPGTVAVLPEGRAARVEAEDSAPVLALGGPADDEGAVGGLFASAAEAFGPGAVAASLEGPGGHGLAELAAVARAGGLALLHDKNAILREPAAVPAGEVLGLPLEDIAGELGRYLRRG